MPWWLIPILIGTQLILGRIFKPRVPKPGTPDPFSVPPAEEGNVLPIPFGTQLMTPTVIEWGDTRAVSGHDKEEGRVWYYAGMTLAVCEGEIDKLEDVQFGGKSLALWPTSAENGNLQVVSPTFHSATGPTATFDVVALDLFGGRQEDNIKDGGVDGVIRSYYGSATQGPDSRIITAATRAGFTDAPGNPFVHYIALDGPSTRRNPEADGTGSWYWGGFAQPTPVAVLVARWPRYAPAGDAYRVVNDHDANPVYCIYELLTNERWGCKVATASLDVASFSTAGSVVYGEALGVSFTMDKQSRAKEYIADLLRHINAVLRRDPITGLIGLKLLRDDYTLDDLPTVTEENATEFTVEKDLWGDTVNELKVKHRRFISAGDPGATGVISGEAATATPAAGISVIIQLQGRNISSVTLHNLTTSVSITLPTPGVYVDGAQFFSVPGVIWVQFSSPFWGGGTGFATDTITVDYTAGQVAAQTALRFQDAITRFYDAANQQQTDEVRNDTADLSYFSTDVAVGQRGATLFREVSASLETGTFKVKRDQNTLAPGDVFLLGVDAISRPALVCRVVDVDYGVLEEEMVQVDWIEDLFASGKALGFIVAPEGPPPIDPSTATQTLPAVGVFCIGGVGPRIGLFIPDVNATAIISRSTSSVCATSTVISTSVAGTSTYFDDPQAATSGTYYYTAYLTRPGWVDGPVSACTPCTASTATPGTGSCVLPTFAAIATADTATATLSVGVFDPQGHFQSVAFQTQVGANAPSGFVTDTTSPYSATVTLTSSFTSYITYRVRYFDCDGVLQSQQETFPFSNSPSVGGTGVGDLTLGSIIYREPLWFGSQHGKAIIWPVSLTDLADIPSITDLDYSWKDLTGIERGNVRMQAFVRSAFSGAKLALQYHDGSAWRYYDGSAGPFVDLNTTGLRKGAYVAIESGAFADRKTRLVALGGDGSTTVVVGMALLEWALSASTVAPSEGSGSSSTNTYGDCSLIASDGFEYTSTADMISAGWTLSAFAGATWTLDATHTDTGSKALKIAVVSSQGTAIVKRTFGTADGLSASTTYTFVAKIYVDPRPSGFDVDFYLRAGGSHQSAGVGVAGSFVEQKVTAATNGSGNVLVELIRGPGFPVNISTNAWYDSFKILNGASC